MGLNFFIWILIFLLHFAHIPIPKPLLPDGSSVHKKVNFCFFPISNGSRIIGPKWQQPQFHSQKVQKQEESLLRPWPRQILCPVNKSWRKKEENLLPNRPRKHSYGSFCLQEFRWVRSSGGEAEGQERREAEWCFRDQTIDNPEAGRQEEHRTVEKFKEIIEQTVLLYYSHGDFDSVSVECVWEIGDHPLHLCSLVFGPCFETEL